MFQSIGKTVKIMFLTHIFCYMWGKSLGLTLKESYMTQKPISIMIISFFLLFTAFIPSHHVLWNWCGGGKITQFRMKVPSWLKIWFQNWNLYVFFHKGAKGDHCQGCSCSDMTAKIKSKICDFLKILATPLNAILMEISLIVRIWSGGWASIPQLQFQLHSE